MIASERKIYILRQLNEKGVINLREIADNLNISETTVRRDFEKLEKAGKLRRVQGGATLHDGFDKLLDNAQLTMREKKSINRSVKVKVAELAAKEVMDGDTVFLDCGTSISPLADILLRRPVKIVTYNTLILQGNYDPVAEVILVGGQYKAHYNLICGPIAEEMLAKFNYSHAFIGCFGFSFENDATYTVEIDSMNMKMLGIKNAKKNYLLVDQTKVDRTGFYSFAQVSDFDKIFCDDLPDIYKKGHHESILLTDNV